MPHPIFDVPSYPWARPEAIAAHKSLYKAVPQSNRIELLYRECGVGVELLPLALGKAPNDIWQEALESLTVARRLKNLCEIILALADLAAVHPALQAILDAQDVLEQSLLTGDLLFMDRARLRSELGKLSDTNPAVHMLLVRGAPDSGKSWTRFLVMDLARGAGEDPPVYLFEGLVSSVDDVLAELFTALGAPEAAPGRLETEIAWFNKACLKLQEAAVRRNKGLWIVADDLGVREDGPRLDPVIRRFFDQFALRMANPAFARWFRLVLIDYPDGSVPTQWTQGFWVEDRPDETEMHDEAISQFFLHWARRKQKNLAPESAKGLAQDVIAKVAAPSPQDADKPRLQRIHDEVAAVLQTL
jgi:hypothetical protein